MRVQKTAQRADFIDACGRFEFLVIEYEAGSLGGLGDCQLLRHARACRGHPRLNSIRIKKDVDGRDKPGHDEFNDKGLTS